MKQVVKCLILCFCKYLSLQNNMQKYIIPCKLKSHSLDHFPLQLLAAKEYFVQCTLLWLSVTSSELGRTLLALTTLFLLAQVPMAQESRKGWPHRSVAYGTTRDHLLYPLVSEGSTKEASLMCQAPQCSLSTWLAWASSQHGCHQ